MDERLMPLKTISISVSQPAGPHLVARGSNQKQDTDQTQIINSPESAIEALKSKPDFDLLTRVLSWLDPATNANDKFNIKVPGPKATQIIFTLAADIVPDYWNVFKDPIYIKHVRSLKRCIRSASGIRAVLGRLRLFLDECQSENFDKKRNLQVIEGLLELLEGLLKGDRVIHGLWADVSALIPNFSQQVLLWKETISLLAGGGLLSIAAEANQILRESSSDIKDGSWLGDGTKYSTWLGRNAMHMLMSSKIDDAESSKASAQLIGKALTLGYIDHLVETIYSSCAVEGENLVLRISSLMKSLGTHEQKVFLHSLLRTLPKPNFLLAKDNANDPKQQQDDKSLSRNAALIFCLLNDNSALKDALVDWLTGVSGDGAGQDVVIHRIAIAALSNDKVRMKLTLSKTLEVFGDKLSIKHTPILHQEVTTQVFLVIAGYVHRTDAAHLSSLARSSLYLNAISSRLAASSQRASLLGMIVGTAISELVDPKDKRMNFKSEEVNGTEGQWYMKLTKLEDSVGSISDLQLVSASKKTEIELSQVKATRAKSSHVLVQPISESKIISIEEIEDSSDSEDEDLPLYEKPDSDPSDSEDDPTLVERNRPAAPVYIRDLLAGLRDTENFDRHKLALATASQLIRRKASFGSEVSENIEELATLLVGLSDKYGIERFQEMRLQGMIAVLVAVPLQMGQWFSRTFYNGDYSVGQRASILTTLSLGARELAGLAKEDAALTGADISPEKPFPCRKLPDKLHQIYALEATSPMNALTKRLEKSMIQPMAVEAADKLTGPNALKVRTFSSRMAVEKKRSKPIPNALAKVVADGFFFPLTSLWRIHLQAYGTKTVHTGSTLLPLFIKTLALLFHASGPSALALPALTADFWALLLSLRPRAAGDVSVLEALLFGFLTLLDVNANDQRRIADENAQPLLETREWVQGVFERVGSGLGEEGERIRMLCAGVLARVGEVVEKWQRLMVGDLGGFL